MNHHGLGTREPLRNPNRTDPLAKAAPLGLQHVLAMVVSNLLNLRHVAGQCQLGWEVNWAMVAGMCFMAAVSAVETVGNVSGITKGGTGREATNKEVQGATVADGLGRRWPASWAALPNTSFGQNVGLVSMTGVKSRHVVAQTHQRTLKSITMAPGSRCW